MAISLNMANILIGRTKDKLAENFNIVISLDGLQEMVDDLETVLDIDYETLRILNKEVLAWEVYLREVAGILLVFGDRFKNTKDVYDYLAFLSKKNKPEFLKLSPKYKIPSRNLEDAIMLLMNKKAEMDQFMKDITTLQKFIESFARYMRFHYYRTSRLIKHSYTSFKNAGE